MNIENDGTYYKQDSHETLLHIGGFLVVRVLLLNIIFKLETHKNIRLTDISKGYDK